MAKKQKYTQHRIGEYREHDEENMVLVVTQPPRSQFRLTLNFFQFLFSLVVFHLLAIALAVSLCSIILHLMVIIIIMNDNELK